MTCKPTACDGFSAAGKPGSETPMRASYVRGAAVSGRPGQIGPVAG